MGKFFGDKLRSERQGRHLTKAELGNGVFLSRDVFLLETGRREPTAGAVRILAERLAPDGPPASSNIRPLYLELSARQAVDEREYTAAAGLAASAAEAAAAADNPQSWWSMTYLSARCLCTLHAYPEGIRTASLLVHHPLAAERQGLMARAETLLAAAYRDNGNLASAVTYGRRAVQHVQGSGLGPAEFLEACDALVSALDATGRSGEAWEYCRSLMLPLLDTGLSRRTTGKANWSVGNVAFHRGDAGTGLRYHRAAAELLRPGSDVELWARFNNATAAARLTAGFGDDETLACIQHAEAAMAVVGLLGPERLEAMHNRGRWLDLSGDHAHAVRLLSDAYARRDELSPQDAGELALHLGVALAHIGRSDAGLSYLADSEQSFLFAGAGDRAAHAASLAHQLAAR